MRSATKILLFSIALALGVAVFTITRNKPSEEPVGKSDSTHKKIYTREDVMLGSNETDCNWLANITNDYNEMLTMLYLVNEKMADGSIVFTAPIESICSPVVKMQYLGFKALDEVLDSDQKNKKIKDWKEEKTGVKDDKNNKKLKDYIDEAISINLTRDEALQFVRTK